MKLILASASPRRIQLMKLCGLDCQAFPVNADESIICCTPPEAAVVTLATRKAQLAANHFSNAVIIGADTVVAMGKHIYGKPKNKADALEMLRIFSEKTHQVYTGVCIMNTQGNMDAFYSKTEVTFYTLTDEEIKTYVETGEPLDKAGAYGIQGKGALLVKKIDGDYYNVVGLPIAALVRHLSAFGDF